MENYDAVVAGYTCVDMFPRFTDSEGSRNISDLIKPGKLIEVGAMDFSPGGVVPNTGLMMQHFGNKVILNGLLGNDIMGKIAKEYLIKTSSMKDMIKTVEACTAYSIVIAPPSNDRMFLESPGCNQIFNIGHIDFKAVANSRLFHFGYPPLMKQFYKNEGMQLIEMYRQINDLNVVTSLDFCLSDPESEAAGINWVKILEHTLPYVDIFAPSIEELIQVLMPKNYSDMISNCKSDFEDYISLQLIRKLGSWVINAGSGIVMIKMGKRGIYILTGDISRINSKLRDNLNKKRWMNREIYCNAYKADTTKIINTSGSGDTAIAAFLTAILKNLNLETAIRYAALAGRERLYYKNTFRNMTTWKSLTEKLEFEETDIVTVKNNYKNEKHII